MLDVKLLEENIFYYVNGGGKKKKRWKHFMMRNLGFSSFTSNILLVITSVFFQITKLSLFHFVRINFYQELTVV